MLLLSALGAYTNSILNAAPQPLGTLFFAGIALVGIVLISHDAYYHMGLKGAR